MTHTTRNSDSNNRRRKGLDYAIYAAKLLTKLQPFTTMYYKDWTSLVSQLEEDLQDGKQGVIVGSQITDTSLVVGLDVRNQLTQVEPKPEPEITSGKLKTSLCKGEVLKPSNMATSLSFTWKKLLTLYRDMPPSNIIVNKMT